MNQHPHPFRGETVRDPHAVPAENRVRIGHVVSVSGAHAIAVLERADTVSERHKDPRIQVGGVVRIQVPGSAVVGLISAISAPMPEMAGNKYDIGLIEINLTGEIGPVNDARRLLFRRGVTCLPSLGDGVFVADREDLNCIFAPPATHSIRIGSLYQDSAVPARLTTDDLLRKHFIVVGSTGSGKSCVVTCILQRMLAVRKTAHIVILDIHNEYSNAFGDLVERITLQDFNLPLWMLNFNELCVALTSDDSYRDDEIEILSEGVLYAKKRYAEAAAGRSLLARRQAENLIITADTPSPFRVSDVIAFIQNELGRLERTRMIAPFRRLKAKLEMLAVDKRYAFMFGSLTVEDTMTDVLGRLFRIPNEGRPISVIDLSTVPHEILDVVVSVIARLAFDLAVWSEGGLPMLIVCEEAHRYVPVGGDDKFVPTRAALGRIAKEGRKYGVSLGLVTQRPSELDTTILSQCSTAIALRLTSERDQQVIRSSTYEGMVDLIDFLPLLADREAIILGQGTAMPMRVRIDDLAAAGLPHYASPGFPGAPAAESLDRSALEAIVTRWRTAGREKASV